MATRRVFLESPQLSAAILSTKVAGAEMRKQIYAQSRGAIGPEWSNSIAAQIAKRGGPQKLATLALVKTARVQVGQRGVRLTSATSKKRLRGGFMPAKNWNALERGTYPRKKTIKATRKGTTYTYERTVGNGFLMRGGKGNYLRPVADEFVTRYASLWIQTTARVVYDALEGKL